MDICQSTAYIVRAPFFHHQTTNLATRRTRSKSVRRRRKTDERRSSQLEREVIGLEGLGPKSQSNAFFCWLPCSTIIFRVSYRYAFSKFGRENLVCTEYLQLGYVYGRNNLLGIVSPTLAPASIYSTASVTLWSIKLRYSYSYVRTYVKPELFSPNVIKNLQKMVHS